MSRLLLPWLLPWAIALVIGSVLLTRIGGSQDLAVFSYICLFFVGVLACRQFGLREAYLISASLLLAVVCFRLSGNPLDTLLSALQQAAFLMVFIFLLAMLHETASLSPSVQRCGEFLTNQPPGRRYSSLFWGSNVIALIFNLGIISLLCPLVKTRNSDEAAHIDESRQLGAILRGLSWTVVWSPTALAPLALLELIPGIDRILWSIVGFGLTVLIFLAGRLEDTHQFRTHRLQVVTKSQKIVQAVPWWDFARFGGVCLALSSIIIGLMAVFDETIVFGLMLACPLMMIGWLGIIGEQSAHGAERECDLEATPGRLVSTIGNMVYVMQSRLPVIAPVAVSLACSGFIGHASASIIPARALAESLGVASMPDFVLLSLIPPAMVCVSYLALSPIMLAVFLGSLFGSLEVLPADPTWLALSISVGWALSMTSSPFATAVLLMSKMNNRSGWQLSMQWHWRFNIACALTASLVFMGLTGGQ